MGLLTVVANGQSLTVAIKTPANVDAVTYSDAGRTSAISLPLDITADQDFHFPDGTNVVTVTVTTSAGLQILNQTVEVNDPDHEVLTPLPSAAQEAATDSATAGGSIPTGQDGTATDVTLSYGAVRSFVTDSGAVVIAVGLAGEDFPRALVTSDGQMFFGDGTADPSAGTVYLYGDGSSLNIGADLWFLSGSSPVMASANNSHHRVKVANNGAISTEGLSGAPSWSPVDIAAPAIGNAGQAVVVNGSGNGFEYGAPAAAATPYDGSTSGIGWDVQSALDNLAARVTALETP